MRIGMDVRKYSDFGIGTYIQNLLHEFDSKLQHDLVLFAMPDEARLIASRHRGTVVENSSGKYSLSELFTLSMQSRKMRCDLFHAPHYTLPLFASGKKVVTIHDLIHLHFPEHYGAAQRWYANKVMSRACSAADAIVTDSTFTKEDLIQTFSVRPEKIHVIHLGVSPGFSPISADVTTGREEGALGTPYVLYVGSLKPHKNVPVLLKAFAELSDLPQLRLVISGEEIQEYPVLASMIAELGIGTRVISAGRKTRQQLVGLYQKATVVVLPSLYEGFGFPILEAMACGVPVIGARTTSIPEVMGEGGLLFDPLDPSELAGLIRRLFLEEDLRRSQRAYGLLNVTRFSREECALKTIGLYESLVPGV